jgi:hypothetical protein
VRKEINLMNTHAARTEVVVGVLEVRSEAELLLLEVGELVEACVEGVAVEDGVGVETTDEGVLEGVFEVLGGVLTGETLDEGWEGEGVDAGVLAEVGVAEDCGLGLE